MRCLCNDSITLSIIAITDRFVGFSVCLDNRSMAIAAVYASTSMIKRMELWKDLNNIQVSNPLPWAFFGDFNAIMGAFEHRGRNNPAKQPMADFISWTDCNNLFHFPTIGAKFTWSNKRDPPFFIERRLDRCIGNSLWLDICSSIVVSTLPKICSDHYPLLLDFHIHSIKVTSQIKFLRTWSLHDNCKELIFSAWSQNIVGCPINSEDNLIRIQECIQTDGISASLKQQEFDAQASLNKAMDVEEQFWRDKSRFFISDWLLPGFNANSIILIPKVKGSDSLDLFKPILVSNFKFKIITKILADRLASIMPFLISKEQRGFIQGRHIHDFIGLASEAFNLLDSKAWCGNVTLKVDIAKAFDTLDWSFRMKVLHKFDFNGKFCLWIDKILKSAHLSVNINEVLYGYSNCSRGVRQEDPLSPLLFCLVEELDLIKGPNNIIVPSHILYADNAFIFCRGKFSNIKNLIYAFEEYATVSGQHVNCNKSFLYGGSLSVSRLNILANMSGFKIGTSPFVYLGVPIFKGKPKVVHLRPIADKIIQMQLLGKVLFYHSPVAWSL
ncbi:uncharacterized protein LOC131658449 [Vicia villosa]|uniref:uncharacterized protein LOC131658449 n=1 Tax=Vicia villosa TaxID=3911 RepID=UPI00273C067F|nr:uncharacterized protein LOC131658449 [Vicia villosa]